MKYTWQHIVIVLTLAVVANLIAREIALRWLTHATVTSEMGGK